MATQLQEAVRPCLGGLHVLVQMLAPSFGGAFGAAAFFGAAVVFFAGAFSRSFGRALPLLLLLLLDFAAAAVWLSGARGGP